MPTCRPRPPNNYRIAVLVPPHPEEGRRPVSKDEAATEWAAMVRDGALRLLTMRAAGTLSLIAANDHA